jgi:Sua5/YciO/YrdC/YwlC family protein
MTKIYDFKDSINEKEVEEIGKLISDGNLVIFPTETVYGIGTNALFSDSIENIFISKGRANDNPLIVHVSDVNMIKELVLEISSLEQELINNFMPGPFTLILPKKDIIPNNVTANLDTVGIRVPENEIARRIIKAANVPVAAPSANISSKPSGTMVDDILNEFDNKVAAIVDGGQTDIGVESTVVKVIDDIPTILRPGKITREDIINEIGICEYSKNINVVGSEKVESPGMKYKHYAPNTKCILLYSEDENKLIDGVNDSLIDSTVVIGPSEYEDIINVKYYLKYGSKDNLEEISHNIFSLIRKADTLNADLIIICGVKNEGLGVAIMNRLIRSANFNYIFV